MIKLALASALLLVPVQASGQTSGQDLTGDLCPSIENMATSIMTARQDGVPMSAVMAKTKTDVPSLTEILRKMVMDAYQRGQYQTPSVRKQAIDDFVIAWTTACYKAGENL